MLQRADYGALHIIEPRLKIKYMRSEFNDTLPERTELKRNRKSGFSYRQEQYGAAAYGYWFY